MERENIVNNLIKINKKIKTNICMNTANKRFNGKPNYPNEGKRKYTVEFLKLV